MVLRLVGSRRVQTVTKRTYMIVWDIRVKLARIGPLPAHTGWRSFLEILSQSPNVASDNVTHTTIPIK
jgi:hypothetical protein